MAFDQLKWRSACIAVALLLSASQVSAERVGTAVVGGKTVTLDSNGTWKYQDASEPKASSTCDIVKTLTICAKALRWERSPNKIGAFDPVYALDRKLYLGVINEPIGTKDGVTKELMQRAILGNAASAAKIPATDVPVLASSDRVDEVEGAQTVSFTITLNGAPLTYQVVFLVQESQSWQLTFWTVGKQFSPEMVANIKAALKSTKFA